MAFIIDRANAVAAMLEKFTTAFAYQVAGQYANIEFWTSETCHALNSLAEYQSRFERLAAAQRDWIDAHKVVVGTYCPMCGGRCEFNPHLKCPTPPTKIPSRDRDIATRRLKDAFYFFILRCYRMNLIDEQSLRDVCARVATSVEASDLIRR